MKPKDTVKNTNKKVRNKFLAQAALCLAEGTISKEDFNFLVKTKNFPKDADGYYINLEATDSNVASVLKKLHIKKSMELL